ncbi:glycerol-3-phosphate 1-O-acyltransferase PlsY [Caldalkalibacillus salinus]|uniref:glycerol-3-phosphate 1-O-acyltransferase PlsY n=1 Tax=Caldalkalibacillus salinus TaxID=2803787 RepID=UPI001921D00E|nr:glycerol-3-phosphate 1-O-acyltransferase PlsY [Caldalkalibacillus salinus]
MEAVLTCIVAYLIGSVSFSYIIAKKVAGIDIRQHGSKNAGATNTLRLLGTGPAVLVLLLDALKGIVAVLFAMWWNGIEWVVVLSGLLAILGHNWPIFFNFKGGKGVATTIGVVATLAFLPSLLSGMIAITSIVIWRYVSLGSLIFVTLLPLMMVLLGTPAPYMWGAIVLMILSYIRHRANIVRIIKGEENKIGSKVGENKA